MNYFPLLFFFFCFGGGFTVIDLNWATKVACLVLFFFFSLYVGIVEVDVEV